MDDISQELFNILKGANYKLRLFTQDGHKTLEPSEATRFYVFEEDLMVTVRQDDGSYEVVIQAGNGFNISDHLDLMDSLKKIVHSHLGKFSVRKFDKTIEPKDFKHQNVKESQKFSRPFGSIKTSYVKAPNSTKLIVKHSKRVNEEKRGARSRYIHKIFIENKKGEKFAFPYPYVTGAKAMTRHVAEGGTPYDNRGMTILQMCEDLLVMKKMLKGVKKGKLINEENIDTINNIKETISTIQRDLSRSISNRGYNNFQENILEKYLDNEGNHVYNTLSETNLDEDDHRWFDKVKGAVNRVFRRDDKLQQQSQETQPVKLAPLDYPLHLDVHDMFYREKFEDWMHDINYDTGKPNVPFERIEEFRRDRLYIRDRMLQRLQDEGINLDDHNKIQHQRIEQKKAATNRANERAMEDLKKYKKHKLGEDMDNVEDTTREHFQTRLVTAMLELFRNRNNLNLEIDPNDPEHPDNENPAKYASALGEVAKLSSLLSYIAINIKDDSAFAVLTELSERIHDMDDDAIVMVYKMADAIDKAAQTTSEKTEESVNVSLDESVLVGLSNLIR